MRALVTGATGFLGGTLARRLLSLGWKVTGLGRNVAALAGLERLGIRTVRADLGDRAAIANACENHEIVFHCGALAAPWGKASEFHNANVVGTENVIRGCQLHNVQRLVHVSTPSIYFERTHRLLVREDARLPSSPANEYIRTKLIAETMIDAASSRGLPVVTIRPRAIFGPGDTTILPRLIARLEKGGLPVIGNGKNVADLSYVENVVDALILCTTSPARTLGRKYNITNGEPVVLWDVIRHLAEALGLRVPRRHIPYKLADRLAAVMEFTYRLLPGQPEPPLTRYSVGIIALSTTLNIEAARQELAYVPRISIEEGLEKFIEWWKARRR